MSESDERVPRAVILGCAGPALSDAERDFFADADPLGFILFERNCHDPDQLRGLVDSLRRAVGRVDAPVLIDQEGGRVARLGPPHWERRPPARAFGRLAESDGRAAREAAYLNARLIAADLATLGIDVDCAPVADVPVEGAHDVIGDRAFSHDPATVASLALAVCEGLIDGGVQPVIKHIPGHGRARADSHRELPVVDAPLAELEKTDFVPFRAMGFTAWAMTAHILYTAIDETQPGSASPRVIGDVIRGDIGFDGVLISDDIAMRALHGGVGERAASVLAAGCDLALHCTGDLDEMIEVSRSVGPLSREARVRLAAASRGPDAGFEDSARWRRRLEELMPDAGAG